MCFLVGKIGFVLNMMLNIVWNGYKIFFFSFEIIGILVLKCMLLIIIGIELIKIKEIRNLILDDLMKLINVMD